MKWRRLRKACDKRSSSDESSSDESSPPERRKKSAETHCVDDVDAAPLARADAPCGGTVLETRYEDRKIVGKLGAKYNGVIKKWVVPKNHGDIGLFKEWIRSGTMKERHVRLSHDSVRRHLCGL
jgi:hypothetical protein